MNKLASACASLVTFLYSAVNTSTILITPEQVSQCSQFLTRSRNSSIIDRNMLLISSMQSTSFIKPLKVNPSSSSSESFSVSLSESV